MKKILWASAHQPTEKQRKELNQLGDVTNIRDLDAPNIFESPDEALELNQLACQFLSWAAKNGFTLIVQPAGSPAFQFMLGMLVRTTKIRIGYAHSERKSVEVINPDGTVTKQSIFEHKKFIIL